MNNDIKLIALLGLAHAISHFFHLVIPPLFPWIKPEFGLSYAELGVIMSAFFIVSSMGQAACGFLVDAWGAKRTLFLGLGLLALGGFTLACAQNYWMVFASSVISGLGNSVFHPTDYSIMNRKLTEARLPLAFSVHQIVGSIGWAMAPVTMIAVANLAGWRAAAFTAGAITIAIIVLLALHHTLFELKSQDDVASDASQTDDAPQARKVGRLAFLTSLAVWLCFFFFFFNSFALAILQNFAPTIFQATYGLNLELATAALTAYLVCNAIGVVIGGWVAKHFVKHDRVVALCLTVSGVTAVLMATQLFPGLTVLAFMSFMGLGVGIAGPSRDLLIRGACLGSVGKDAFGRVYGFTYCGMDVGQTLAPMIAGPLLDLGFYSGALSLVALTQFAAVFTALGVGEKK